MTPKGAGLRSGAEKARRGSRPVRSTSKGGPVRDDALIATILEVVKKLERSNARMEARVAYISENLALQRAAEDLAPLVPQVKQLPKPIDPAELRMYLSAADIEEKIALPEKHLRLFHTAGYVRSWKIGESRQGIRKYRVSDVLEALARLEAGLLPRKKRKAQ